MNDKFFNEREWSYLDVICTAIRESEEWLSANSQEEAIPEIPLMDGTMEVNHVIFTCFIDESWKDNEQTSGIRWIIELQDGMSRTTDLLGLKGTC